MIGNPFQSPQSKVDLPDTSSLRPLQLFRRLWVASFLAMFAALLVALYLHFSAIDIDAIHSFLRGALMMVLIVGFGAGTGMFVFSSLMIVILTLRLPNQSRREPPEKETRLVS